MSKAEQFLAVLLFGAVVLDGIAVFALALLASFSLALALIILACLFGVTGGLALSYGYVRRHRLRGRGQLSGGGQPSEKDGSGISTSPPSHFLILGWGMLVAALVLFGLRLFWLH
ncbi:hypothetical protein [Thermogemmatispora tikiterensis]|uniref:Uncharacterized protein n=1 Tax=Thermogemmatispora tikiterensis TaxID=1825093 RepID=A0A328VQL7_9CHLR|nr:hypothetical protein [Thermogemmatispora tikiterensis]RAQ97963.1 hypothetical protein A4R35_20660 [Thermogemmatispora tikiterensis]